MHYSIYDLQNTLIISFHLTDMTFFEKRARSMWYARCSTHTASSTHHSVYILRGFNNLITFLAVTSRSQLTVESEIPHNESNHLLRSQRDPELRTVSAPHGPSNPLVRLLANLVSLDHPAEPFIPSYPSIWR